MRRLQDACVWLGIFLVGTLLACMLAYPALAEEEDIGVSYETAQEEPLDTCIEDGS